MATGESDSAPEFTAKELAELKEAYALLDVNGSGRVSVEELRKFMEFLGMTPSESDLYDMIDIVDIDGNHTIDYQEFLKFMKSKDEVISEMEVEIRESFRVFDHDEDGYITTSEFKQILTGIGEVMTTEEVHCMLQQMDANDDGKVSCDELVAFFIKSKHK